MKYGKRKIVCEYTSDPDAGTWVHYWTSDAISPTANGVRPKLVSLCNVIGLHGAAAIAQLLVNKGRVIIQGPNDHRYYRLILIDKDVAVRCPAYLN